MKNSSRKMTPFDFLKLVHDKKIKWEDLNEDEQKTYNKFIINRALGFNNNMLDIVNRLQGYDVTPKARRRPQSITIIRYAGVVSIIIRNSFDLAQIIYII